jgi:hypothetical protein
MLEEYCLAFSTDRDLGDVVSEFYKTASGSFENDVFRGLQRLCTDNLGRGTIYYFPGVPYQGKCGGDEENDSED